MFGEVPVAAVTEATGLSDPAQCMPGLPAAGQTRLGFTHSPRWGWASGPKEQEKCRSSGAAWPVLDPAVQKQPGEALTRCRFQGEGCQLPSRLSLSSGVFFFFYCLHTACMAVSSHTTAARPNNRAQLWYFTFQWDKLEECKLLLSAALLSQVYLPKR